ncbi:MAG: TraR/DksA C4-type zinc finger protein [Acidimicrobiales bacterium]|nr:TraR/DksA C4-type zinc finger protein [Acidimicrobiales bacterium]
MHNSSHADVVADERATVAAQVASLEQSFEDIVDSSELVSTDDEHDPEGATIAYERAQVASLLESARRRLDELDAAIERIEAGTYGRCDECGGAIAPARLEVLPATPWCVACA